MLDSMRDGFFVEAGAADGQTLSNTLFLEMERNWTGLLVEPNPDMFYSLLQKKRLEKYNILFENGYIGT